MAHKIVTYSMDTVTIERMEQLMSWMGVPQKSKVLSVLVEREYYRQRQQREDEGISQD